MAKLPCPRCGNKNTLGTFCKDCLRELHPLVKQIKSAKLVLCAGCDNVKLHSDWKHMPQQAAVEKAVSHALEFGESQISSVEIADAAIERKPGIKKTAKVLIVVTGMAEGSTEYEEDYDVPLYYEVTMCPRCGKKSTAYFEGILQVRNQTPAVHSAIAKYLKEHKNQLRLAKEVPVGSGSDYYLSDQRAVHHMARQLHAAFGGELKINAQHFSYDHAAGKNLYRVNAYLEIPEFSKGDVITKDDKYYFVLSVGPKVRAENLMTGQHEGFAYSKGVAVRLPVKTTQVSKVDPIEVLHPVSFQSVVPTNSKYAPAELDVDEQVSVAIDGNYLFLIPYREEKDETKQRRKRHSQKRGRRDQDLIQKD